MKRWLLCCGLGMALTATVLGQPAEFWINDGIINSPPDVAPQIDATNFVNNNTMILNNLGLGFDDRPLFDTSDTLNFTNNGIITVNTGLRFDTEPATIGYARWAANFDNPGVINSGTDTNFLTFNFFPTTTYVSATNLVSHGTFNMGFESVLHLSGSSVDLSRGLVTMQETGLSFGNFFFTTNQVLFFNQGFLDGYWGLSTNIMNPAAQFGAIPAIEPVSLVTDRAYLFQIQQLGGLSYKTYLSDQVDATGSNRFVRAVFLNNTNAGVTANVYLPFFGDIIVEWISHPSTELTNFLYLFDDFGIVTNFQLVANGLAGPRPTFIPINYTFFSGFQFFFGAPETPTIIPPGTFISGAVTNQYSAFEALFLPTTRGLNDTPGQNITNVAGRVEITATNSLDLTLARITADNYLLLNATNQFMGSIGSKLISPYYDLNLRSTNGTFVITNVVVPTSPKPEGTIQLYSARWTNDVAGVTNRYHVLFVDTQLAPTLPTRQQDVFLRSTNLNGGTDSIVLSDELHITRNLLLDTTALTIATNDPSADSLTGGIKLESTSILWSTSTPRLQYLTNFGFIETSNAVFFAGSRSSPFFSSTFQESYRAFVNIGTVTNYGSLIWADYFLNAGTFFAGNNGSIDLRRSQTAVLTNGAFIAPGGDISLASGSLVVSNHAFIAGRAISIAATNFLDDGSLLSSSADLITNKNVWVTGNGFNILAAPAQGSLLGTTVSNSAAPYQKVINRFAAADRGCVPDGFVNNAAVGRLILDGGVNSLFEFAGVGGANALYVDSLELVDFTATNRDFLGNFAPGIQVDPNMKVYFGQALANGSSVAEKLNGLSDGRLCWVSNYNCGFFSSTNLIYPGGATNRVNTALAQSCDIDSNGNGIPNCMDPAPIPGGGCILSALGGGSSTNVPPATGGGDISGGHTSSAGSLPTLDFPLSSGGTIQGAFLPVKVSYNGLFYDTNGGATPSSGFFTAKSTDSRGGFSGSLVVGSGKYGFSGHFDASGHFSVHVPKTSLTLSLQLDPQSADQLHGTVTDGHWSADLVADRQVSATLKAGKYTVIIPGDAGDNSSPGGHGFGTATVDGAGVIKWSGTLADGTKVTQSSALSKQGIWPLYAPLYGGSGAVISWIQFANQADSDLSGHLIWMKPAASSSKYYPLGFTNDVMATGSAYRAPLAGTRVIKMTVGNLMLTGGGLHSPLTNSLTLGLNNRVSVPAGSKLTLTITTSSGLFKGTALNPETGKTVPFQGMLFEKANIGIGYFLGADQSGEVYLSPAQ